jgi:hypothetical protein
LIAAKRTSLKEGCETPPPVFADGGVLRLQHWALFHPDGTTEEGVPGDGERGDDEEVAAGFVMSGGGRQVGGLESPGR